MKILNIIILNILERMINMKLSRKFVNDYIDLLILGDYYTKGTWAVSLASQYRLRYKFNGSFNLSYREDVR